MDLIYIADDNKANRYYVEKITTGAGYDVKTYKNGKELFDAFISCTPDLIITDLSMPAENFFQMCSPR